MKHPVVRKRKKGKERGSERETEMNRERRRKRKWFPRPLARIQRVTMQEHKKGQSSLAAEGWKAR